MERANEDPPVAVVLQPYHDLGLGLGRHLSRRGARVVAVDPDPASGEAFCRRLAWEGGAASYRFAAPGQRGAATALLSDLELVYGRVDWLISFFAGPRHPLGWLQLKSDLASQLIERHVTHRLEFLKSLAPLLEKSVHRTMIQVSLGVEPRVEGAVAGFWDRLLANRWADSGIATVSLATGASAAPPGPAVAPGTGADLERLIAALDAAAP